MIATAQYQRDDVYKLACTDEVFCNFEADSFLKRNFHRIRYFSIFRYNKASPN